MEVTVCSQDGEVSLNFILPEGLTEETCSTSLVCAYQACQENGLNPVWLPSADCIKLSPTKQDVFVCDPFEGEAFKHLTEGGFKCVVLGPRCLLTCLHRKEPIPELPSPIHNTAMKGMVVTTTGFEKDVKAELQMLVERMAAIYSNNFHEGVTHLVANAVGSKKYIVAVEKEIPVMTGEWVQAVWKAVNRDFREDILATDQQFLSYTCPVFKGLVICVSQMHRKEKDALMKMIQDNGGTYSGSLEMAVTSVLIIPTPEGEKYTHACNWRIQCLTPDWIYDSVEQGHALDMEGYKVKKTRGASTPTNDMSVNDGKNTSRRASFLSVPPDVSMCSTIMNETDAMKVTHINETLQMDTSIAIKKNSAFDEKVNRGIEAVEELDLQQAMKAGLFLDGCKIFLSGFSGTHIEKLRRILNAGGATRFNQLTDSVSHVVIGKIVDEHLTTIQSWPSKPHLVYGDWITESIKQKRPADEAQFAHLSDGSGCSSNSPKPPRRPPRVPVPSQQQENNETYVDEAIINQYLKPGAKLDDTRNVSLNETANMSALPDSQTTFVQGMFSGKIFTVSGYNEEVLEDLITTIQDHGGEVVSQDYKGRVHYTLTNLDGTGEVHANANEIISHFFIEECLENEGLLDVEYYHMPLVVSRQMNCLEDCTVAISTYKGKERLFLVTVANALGARFQEVFAKKDNRAKDIKTSTHLICPSAEGDKYRAAVKWGVPAVTRDWLIECIQTGEREPEDSYKVDNKNRREVNYKEIIRNLILKGHSDEQSSTVYRVEETVAGDITEVVATPMNHKVRALREQGNVASPSDIKTPDLETMRRLYPTPGVGKGNETLNDMPTPDTPYGSTWFPNPSSRVRKGFKRMLDSIPDAPVVKKRATENGTPMNVLYKKFFNNVQETLDSHEQKFSQRMAANEQGKEEHQSGKKERKDSNEEQGGDETVAADNHGPLTGVVVCTARKLQDQQRELYKTVAELGGDYRWAYDHSVTHFVYQGRHNDTNKEFRLAREQGKLIVAPEWVHMCRDEETRIDESLFPHTHNPKMSLSILSAKTTPVSKRGRPRKKPLDDTSPDLQEKECEEQDTSHSNESENESGDTANDEEQKKAAISRQLEEIEALATVTGSGRRSAGSARNRSLGEKLKHTPTRPIQVEAHPATMEVAESQNTAITWDDPQEREARLHLQNQLTKDTQEIISAREQHDETVYFEEDKENTPSQDESAEESTVIPHKTKKRTYLIILSGMPEDEKNRYSDIVESLGGLLSQEQNHDPKGTHVVTAKPSRSEKHLAAIASGKWMLYISFLEESMKLGHFVEEEPHEWGNPEATFLPKLQPGSLETKLATAAHRWRLAIQDMPAGDARRGAFCHMRALVHSSKERTAAFIRLIQAGGGEIVLGKPPYKDVTDVTHFFVEANKNPAKFDLAKFAADQVPCLAPVFLNEYLVKDPVPDEMEHCIPEYKEIVASMSKADQSLIRRTRKR
ncbi:DNA topoisomerase 2-binding protein 1 isoform X2 [Penaeus vannamei]|uniref:DNA topoisomerase 2-binding protein 1 isoform X2 n=1 Tax=Penaeus vannamei TaxID=6689 RepID=UPI00387F3F99